MSNVYACIWMGFSHYGNGGEREREKGDAYEGRRLIRVIRRACAILNLASAVMGFHGIGVRTAQSTQRSLSTGIQLRCTCTALRPVLAKTLNDMKAVRDRVKLHRHPRLVCLQAAPRFSPSTISSQPTSPSAPQARIPKSLAPCK